MIKTLMFMILSLTMPLVASTTRAAFDLGSGKFKLLVAEVDGSKVDVKFSKMLPVELGMDLAASSDGNLSESIQREALQALQDLKQEAIKYGAEEFVGVTTAVFRKAKNGEAVLDALREQTGIGLHLVSQQREGEIGFHTASVLASELDEEHLISWDSGNASFQITFKDGEDYEVYEGPMGNSQVCKMLAEEVRNKPFGVDFALNPLSIAECQELITAIQNKLELPTCLEKKLSDVHAKMVGIGDGGCIFAMGAKAVGRDEFTLAEVKEAIERLAGSSDEQLRIYRPENPQTMMTRLILLGSVMEKFGIEHVVFKESTGSTLGLLIDPLLWQ